MKREKNKPKYYTLEALTQDAAPAPEGIIEGGLLGVRSMMLLYGAPKSRKTFLAMNLCLAIAHGTGFAGFRISKPHRVLMLSAEGGYYSMRDRIQRMTKHLKPGGMPVIEFMLSGLINLQTPKSLAGLDAKIAKFKPDVIVIDPLIRFHEADENSSQEMGQVLGLLRGLIDEHGVSIILVHHTGKAEAAGARGSSAITGEYDAAIYIKKGTNDVHEIEFDLRHAETPSPRKIRFEKDTFWFVCEEFGPIERILSNSGGMSKKELVDELLKMGRYANNSGAYKAIDNAVKRNQISLEGDRYICLN